MIVDDNHFAYLKLQRGAIADLAGNRAAWQAAYERSLRDDLNSMAHFLPEHCSSVLDVGSGLGGINAKLALRYGADLEVNLLDGWSDPPVMKAHNQTFNDMVVAADFLQRNGVQHIMSGQRPVDLIISLQAWCFHFAPALYLPFVKACCRRETVLILDVRKDKPEWRRDLEREFVQFGWALDSLKFDRLVFHAN